MITLNQQIKIYKIESVLGDKIYIGSTSKLKLIRRLQQHISDYKIWLKNKNKSITRSYKLFEEYGADTCFITLLEKLECKDKKERYTRESDWIRALDCVNNNIPDRNNKQYHIDHKEQRKQYDIDHKKQRKQYRIDHKERYNERSKQYRIDHKEQIKQYRIDHKEQIKQYHIDHKEQIKQCQKKYYESHKKPLLVAQ